MKHKRKLMNALLFGALSLGTVVSVTPMLVSCGSDSNSEQTNPGQGNNEDNSGGSTDSDGNHEIDPGEGNTDNSTDVPKSMNDQAVLQLILDNKGSEIRSNGVGYKIEKSTPESSNLVVRSNFVYGDHVDELAIDPIVIDGKSYQIYIDEIGNGTFENCTILTSIDIPYSVTTIGDNAFANTKLTSIYIPGSVKTIGNGAFYGCRSLTSANIPSSITYLTGFNYCTSLTSINIPDSVKTIGNDAFYGCENLTSITIPNSVTIIGDSAFYGCSKITSINIPNHVTTIGNSAFSGCSKITSINIPNSVITIGDSAFGSTNIRSITIPDSVTYLSGFNDCKNLTSINIPDYVATIGNDAFANTKITSITIPNLVTTIGNNAFGSTNITSINIPNSVTTIGHHAFWNCTKLMISTMK